jgi:ATP-dependent exoDNAse (exonuclease V) alpha subunit
MKVGRGVTGAVRYILGEGRDAVTGDLKTLAAGEDSRVAWFGGMGFGFDIDSSEDADLARRIMEFDSLNQDSPTRRCEKDCVHLSLAWSPGEQPSREEMEVAARSALKTLGMENAKALFASHEDEGYSHIHIVASKLNPDTGRAYDLKGNFLKLSKWAQEYERDHGGVVCLRRESANGLRDAITARDVAAVLQAMTQQRATFTASDLERALFKQIKSESDRVEFAGQVLGAPEAVRLTDREGGPVTRYTTRTALDSEQQVLDAVEGLAAGSRHGVTDHRRAAVLDQFASIRDDQRAAFEHALGPGGVALIDGQAGTGKSFTMNAIRRAYEEAGYRVIGLAPTNAVAQGMGTDGFRRAATVHSEIFALNNRRTQWDRRTVVMVDEAAMIDTKMMAALTAYARNAGAKLILVGDDRQLSSIERGGMFGALKDRYGAAALTEITRQYKQDDRRAAAMMAEGNFSDAIAIYEKKGAITWTRTQEEARARLVHRWTADTEAAPEKSRFVFAYTNVDVDALNQDLREVQRRRGVLGEDREFETAHGKRAFATGDRFQFTATDKKQGIFNGAAGQVVAINGDAITVELDGKRPKRLTFEAGEFKGFRHGYAGTIYKGQGKTLDQTYLYHSEHWRSAASYVALTRHRDKAELFVARNTAADTKQLARQMARVDDRRAASNFREADRVPSQDHDLTIPPAGGDLGLQAPPLTDDQIDWKRYTEDRAYRGVIDAQQEKQRHERHLATEQQRESGRDR